MKRFLLVGLALSLSVLTQAQTLELDPTFGTNGYASAATPGDHTQFYAIQKTTNEAFICLGAEDEENDFSKGFLAKYTNAGVLDNSFGTNGIVKFNDAASINNYYFALALQSDGKILVAGNNQDNITLDETYWVRRYNANGTVDNTFGTNGSASIFNTSGDDGTITNISLQTDGKILINFQTTPDDPAITRLNADGSLDNTFGTSGLLVPDISFPGVSYNYVKALADGKMLVTAYFFGVNGTEIMVYKLNNNGMIDLAFGVNGKFQYNLPGYELNVQNLNLQSDGKIIVGGYSYDPNSASADVKLMLIRLNTNGSPDNTFGTQGIATMTPESGDIEATSVYVLSDDKLIINYGNYDSLYSGLVKFNANGTPDVTFNNNTAIKIIRDIDLGSFIYGIEVQADNKIVFAGASATDVDDLKYHTLIGRLKASGTGITTSFKEMASIYPNPANDKLYINLTKQEATATVFDLLGKKVMEQKIYRNGTLNVAELNSGVYLLHLNAGTTNATQQFSIVR